MYILKIKGVRFCTPEGVFDLNEKTPQRILEYLYRRGYKEVEIVKGDKKRREQVDEQGE